MNAHTHGDSREGAMREPSFLRRATRYVVSLLVAAGGVGCVAPINPANDLGIADLQAVATDSSPPDLVSADLVPCSPSACATKACSEGACVESLFYPPKFYQACPKGLYATDVAAGDFDNDKDVDLVVGCPGYLGHKASVVVFTNDGKGAFQGPVSYDTVDGADVFVATADLDGDGWTDIAFTVPPPGGPGSTGILLNRRDGRFAPAVEIESSEGVESIVAGDFNGDGRTDMVTNGDDLTFFVNQGGGTFKMVKLGQGSHFPCLRKGDFNGDGRPDVALCFGGGARQTAVHLGPFGKGESTPIIIDDATLAGVGDLDGDMRDEILALRDADDNVSNHGLTILGYGNGPATFTSRGTVKGAIVFRASAADINGEGPMDVFGNSFKDMVDSRLGVFLNRRNFQVSPVIWHDLGVKFRYNPIAVDLNRDGKADIAVSQFGGQGDADVNKLVVALSR